MKKLTQTFVSISFLSMVALCIMPRAVLADSKPAPTLTDRVRNSDLIVIGEVTEVRDASYQRKVSEHDPDWKDAIVRVSAVLKGNQAVGLVPVRFPNSHDVAWQFRTKFQLQQKGIWILYPDDSGVPYPGGPARATFATPYPLDFQALDKRDEIEKIINSAPAADLTKVNGGISVDSKITRDLAAVPANASIWDSAQVSKAQNPVPVTFNFSGGVGNSIALNTPNGAEKGTPNQLGVFVRVPIEIGQNGEGGSLGLNGGYATAWTGRLDHEYDTNTEIYRHAYLTRIHEQRQGMRLNKIVGLDYETPKAGNFSAYGGTGFVWGHNDQTLVVSKYMACQNYTLGCTNGPYDGFDLPSTTLPGEKWRGVGYSLYGGIRAAVNSYVSMFAQIERYAIDQHNPKTFEVGLTLSPWQHKKK